MARNAFAIRASPPSNDFEYYVAAEVDGASLAYPVDGAKGNPVACIVI